ncbi:noncanonical pyrimidine nucleotidase, YjjG family [Flavobacterium sp. NST-5]|uniref:Noncanonical pyrimidine nucleotidase, YjjG family n=1 Tax=Flavobacterium ichthyis TaxID=2698827 RepID=A0ABW9ZFF2_9FLAO|nr:YjjG family noncanonical pyrimidine nucleotidase [Flavobacterium ichthyis]NBL65503.1 noncanonical pyrimidine nucleotidase, YjjG family [Flavobacterium ichthyis]
MIFKNKITDIFFDLDHTLWDFEKNSALAFETVLQKNEIAIDTIAFVERYVPVNKKFWDLYQRNQVTAQELRYGRLKEVFESFSHSIDDEKIHFLAEEYISHLPLNNHLYAGALELLDYLQPHYQLHIITNGFNLVQQNKLKNSNILHYFKTVTDSEIAGHKKPSAEIFKFALENAKCNPKTAVMIGDNLEADVEGALSAGLDAIFFNEHNIKVGENIKHVNHLLALKNYF